MEKVLALDHALLPALRKTLDSWSRALPRFPLRHLAHGFRQPDALFLCIALGPWLIGKLRAVSDRPIHPRRRPQSHQKKAGTPTMGGVLIIISIVIPTLLWADLRNSYVWIAVLHAAGLRLDRLSWTITRKLPSTATWG